MSSPELDTSYFHPRVLTKTLTPAVPRLATGGEQQCFARRDPHPEVPFVGDEHLPTKKEAATWLGIAVVLGVVLYGFLWLPERLL